jgi:hypothetical protein
MDSFEHTCRGENCSYLVHDSAAVLKSSILEEAGHSISISPIKYILDGGATSHMTPDLDALSNFKWSKGGVKFGDAVNLVNYSGTNGQRVRFVTPAVLYDIKRAGHAFDLLVVAHEGGSTSLPAKVQRYLVQKDGTFTLDPNYRQTRVTMKQLGYRDKLAQTMQAEAEALQRREEARIKAGLVEMAEACV